MRNNNFRWLWLLLTIGHIQIRGTVYAQLIEPIEYKVCATNKVSTFEKELNEFALQGFRIIPDTKLSTTTAILSKSKPDVGKKYEYKLIDSSGLKIQKSELISQGYRFKATLFDTSGSPFSMLKFYLLFEKEDGNLNPAQDYEVCELKQKCLDESQERGYVPFALAPYLLFTSLTKEGGDPNREPKFYRILSTMKVSTFEKELNEAAQQGFHFFINSNLSEALIVREGNNPTAAKYEYTLMAANKEKDAERLNELSKQGYRPLGNIVAGGYLIFERSAQTNSQDLYTEFKILATRDEKKLESNIQEAASQNWNPVFISGTSAVYRVVLSRTLATKSK